LIAGYLKQETDTY